QEMVFLGEDIMHTRDYSEQTQHIIDEEVERILREQEERAMELLSRHRHGLELVAKELLEKETVAGNEVGRLVDEAHGGPVHPEGSSKYVPRISDEMATGNGVAHTDGASAEGEPTPAPQAEPSPAAEA
ncbi:MAG: hypothetical protein M0Z88_07275, partial [Actinomycetota bacterium]|nr:hypothetical protein [Actinomycetota bacterium]